MSIVEILNNKLCPDIANIIFEYNLPEKKNIKLLKLACCLKIKKLFDYNYVRRKKTRKYYNVLIINREMNNIYNLF